MMPPLCLRLHWPTLYWRYNIYVLAWCMLFDVRCTMYNFYYFSSHVMMSMSDCSVPPCLFRLWMRAFLAQPTMWTSPVRRRLYAKSLIHIMQLLWRRSWRYVLCRWGLLVYCLHILVYGWCLWLMYVSMYVSVCFSRSFLAVDSTACLWTWAAQ